MSQQANAAPTTPGTHDLVAARTTVRHPAADDVPGQLAAMAALRDREAIRDLALLYTRAVDGYDLDAVVDMYTDDGVFERRGRASAGREALREAYATPMRAYRTMIHRVDAHVVELTSASDAVGWVAGYAELADDHTVVTAVFRYDDVYRKVADRWRFAHRAIGFQYAMPLEDLPTGLTAQDRVRWPGTDPRDGDYPESLPGWTAVRR
ncbi:MULTISPECIES: nuclear transport factor 2 family protein [Prauserella salsuginis group]|uniref:Nuclear transport factor 2 family protein n=1 Tax=Prauserella salsuginis TaxID=387889 RepID=A0ABW6G1E0_9PSEU|nr:MULTISPECIES: nuclear transport factor 2 family protein [Prauserella salsuginis group]MCR3722160.1 Ketosteroid isomerase homolog [Prauserella flava]MCR3736158.1 Ketosteroid isomerase homolog [Prauserella salsuginis]